VSRQFELRPVEDIAQDDKRRTRCYGYSPRPLQLKIYACANYDSPRQKARV
jgi:hypothetical protein